MKIIKNIVSIVAAMCIFSLQAKEISLTIENKLDTPVIMSVYVANHPETGIFGILIPAKTTEEVIFNELYWFAKQALGGFVPKGQRSNVRNIEVLNHSFPTQLELAIQNQESQKLTLKPESLTINIIPAGTSAKVTVKKASL